MKNFKNKTYIIDDPTYHAFLSVLFFVNFLETYNGDYTSKDIRKKYFQKPNEKVLTPTGYLTITYSNHLQQPVYILKLNIDKRYSTVYKTPIEIHPNPWFNKFSNKIYDCNNTNFLGSKYLVSI